MTIIHFLPQNKHVADRAEGLGVVMFVQNNYRVLHVAVKKVKLEVGTN